MASSNRLQDRRAFLSFLAASPVLAQAPVNPGIAGPLHTFVAPPHSEFVDHWVL